MLKNIKYTVVELKEMKLHIKKLIISAAIVWILTLILIYLLLKSNDFIQMYVVAGINCLDFIFLLLLIFARRAIIKQLKTFS